MKIENATTKNEKRCFLCFISYLRVTRRACRAVFTLLFLLKFCAKIIIIIIIRNVRNTHKMLQEHTNTTHIEIWQPVQYEPLKAPRTSWFASRPFCKWPLILNWSDMIRQYFKKQAENYYYYYYFAKLTNFRWQILFVDLYS